MVAHACNPSTLGGRGRQVTRLRDQNHPGQHDEPPSLLKIQKISWVWWPTPVDLATWEAEFKRIAWTREAEVAVSQDCATALQPGDRGRLCLEKKKSCWDGLFLCPHPNFMSNCNSHISEERTCGRKLDHGDEFRSCCFHDSEWVLMRANGFMCVNSLLAFSLLLPCKMCLASPSPAMTVSFLRPPSYAELWVN